jgi:predicted DNA-binding transcriptional regulator YafY
MDYSRIKRIEPEGKLYNVKLRFAPEIVPDVITIQRHSTQKVAIQADGSAIIEFCVDGICEIKRWILSYGDKVHVLEPKILRESIRETLENVANMNR